MNSEKFSMVQECTNKYLVQDLNQDEFEIFIRAPKKFQSLWMIKLSELRTTIQEIEEYVDDESSFS